MSHKLAKRRRSILGIKLRTIGAIQGSTRPERRRELAEALKAMARKPR